MIVTGGGRGIGAAIARAGAAAGYDIALTYVADPEAAARTVATIEDQGGSARAFAADVADAGAVETMFTEAEDTFGPVTALVTCAGISGQRSRLADTDLDDMKRVIDVNLTGTMICARAALRRMTGPEGRPSGGIVLVSSQAAQRGGDRLAAYASSKAAVNVLTVALGREVSGTNVRVNCVSPGIIATDMLPLDDAAWVERTSSSIPAGRLGDPGEVASAVLWLLSDDSSYVNGHVLDVTGGR